MGTFAWNDPGRRELYLGSRILADRGSDGDWLQWGSETLLDTLELYSDPQQGVGSWKFENEASLAKELAERLWALVEENPYEAAERLAEEAAEPVRQAAADLAGRMLENGRHRQDTRQY